ncbi:MAG: hypothetical protein AABO41_27720 [Acidobacteriota bacterium]
MTKQPEEGEIWEWRAFGSLTGELEAAVHAYPVRMSLVNIEGKDIYFIAPKSNHNIKLRKYDDRWLLKFKLLLGGAPGEAELYNESAAYTYSFPIERDKLKVTSGLLRVKLKTVPAAVLSADEFTRALAEASPPVGRAEVNKKRSQFEFDGGWIELAEVWFAKHHTNSISIHSPDREAVELMRQRLSLGEGWEVMNYVEACRRWA